MIDTSIFFDTVGLGMPGSRRLRIKMTADERIGFVAMFEPLGQTYDLEPGQHMYADVGTFYDGEDELEVIQWPGGISIWAPGPITTYDAAGNKLDELT